MLSVTNYPLLGRDSYRRGTGGNPGWDVTQFASRYAQGIYNACGSLLLRDGKEVLQGWLGHRVPFRVLGWRRMIRTNAARETLQEPDPARLAAGRHPDG